MKGKTFSLLTLGLLATGIIVLGGMTAVIDPYFHYHAPLDFLQYPIYNQRYQNDGILRHFDYDAVITGTSMTENFKASELDALFGVRSVKVPLFGASYKEVNDQLTRALQKHPDIQMIVRGLDYNMLLQDKDQMQYPTYPNYLYDDNLVNDVSYVLNKTVLLNHTKYVLDHTLDGNQTTNFDDYSNWMASYTFGKEAVDATYTRPELVTEQVQFTDEHDQTLKGNIEQNVLALAEAYPDTEFYLFFSPYSIYHFDSLNQSGTLSQQLAAEKTAIEMMLLYDNIHIFSFFDCFDMICDLDNYKDIFHYGEWVNSQILVWMRNGEHELTQDNYLDYCNRVREFYTNYDYNSLFAAPEE